MKNLFTSTEEGVSPTVGIILVVLVTVLLSIAVGVFVFELGQNQSTPATGVGTTVDQQFGEGTISLVSKGSAETVEVLSPLGTPYEIHGPGASTTVLLISGEGPIQILGQVDGDSTVVQSEMVASSAPNPDIIVAKDGTGDYQKIQWGIDNATDSDLIAVKKATYSENINVTTPNVTLLAEHGTVIEDEHPLLDVVSIDSDGVTMKNFIVDGDPIPGDNHYARNCISIRANDATLVANELRNCSSTSTITGSALYIDGISVTVLSNNITNGDFGIHVVDGAGTHYIRGNTLADNNEYNVVNEQSEVVDVQDNSWDADNPQTTVNGLVDTYPYSSGTSDTTLSASTEYSSSTTSGDGTSDGSTGDGGGGDSGDGSGTSGDGSSDTDGSSNPDENSPPTADAGADISTTDAKSASFDGTNSYDLDGDPLTYEWEFGDGASATGASPSHQYAAGTYTATLTVSDGHGQTDSDTVQVEVGDAPEVNLGEDVSVEAYDTLQFDANIVYDGSAELTYEWDFGDGSANSTESTATHTYTSAGTYRVTLTVSDGELSDSDSLEVTVDGNAAPSVAISADKTDVETGEPVTFTTSGTDDDGDSVSLSWDIEGDSSTPTGESVTHSFDSPGTYSVVVTATDEHGASSQDSTFISVESSHLAVDTFEGGSLSNYSTTSGACSITTDAYAGDYALDINAGSRFSDCHSYEGDGLANYPNQGDTFEVSFKLQSGARNRIQWATQSGSGGSTSKANGYLFAADASGNSVKISRIGSNYNMDSQSVPINNHEWYTVRVKWETDGDMTATVYDSSRTKIATLTGQDTKYTHGGINFGADNGRGKFDQYIIVG